VDTEHASGAWYAINLTDKARAPVAHRSDNPYLEKELAKFRVIMCPTSGADIRKELGLFRTNNPYADAALIFIHRLFNTPVQDTAHLDRPVVPGAKQIEEGDPGVRTYFVKRRRTTIEKEALDHVERGWIGEFE
jgi:hypothetical protein